MTISRKPTNSVSTESSFATKRTAARAKPMRSPRRFVT
jgi:hypothetical protein